MATSTCQRSYLGQLLRACPLVQLSLRINKNCCQLVSLDCGPNLDVMEDQPKVRVRWTGNKSRYDNKVEDVPAHCILEEDRPASVGRSVRVQLDQGGRIWKGGGSSFASQRAGASASCKPGIIWRKGTLYCTARVHVCCILVVSCICAWLLPGMEYVIALV